MGGCDCPCEHPVDVDVDRRGRRDVLEAESLVGSCDGCDGGIDTHHHAAGIRASCLPGAHTRGRDVFYADPIGTGAAAQIVVAVGDYRCRLDAVARFVQDDRKPDLGYHIHPDSDLGDVDLRTRYEAIRSRREHGVVRRYLALEQYRAADCRIRPHAHLDDRGETVDCGRPSRVQNGSYEVVVEVELARLPPSVDYARVVQVRERPYRPASRIKGDVPGVRGEVEGRAADE